MPRKITVQFGLISIATKAEGALDKPEAMSNLCVGQPGHPAHEATPVIAPKSCPNCDVITDYSALKKGIKQGGGTFAVVEQDDVAEAKEKYTKQYKDVVNLAPHPSAEFLAQTGPGDTVDYLVPDEASAGHYQLLVKLIESHPELSFASLHTPRSATSLYHVRVHRGVLVLEKRTRTDALKPVPSVGGEVNDMFYGMLEAALPTFVTPYVAETYEDSYRKAIADMAATAEIVGGTATKSTGTPVAAAVSDEDIMAKLAELAAQVVAA